MNHFGKESLGLFPTPLYRLENISRALGTNVWIKRDDLCGVALGGNKVRKLEYLLHEAKQQGYDLVMTTGQAQSNHAMLTAACARKLGMDCILVLKERGVTARKGNQVLNHLLDVEVRYMDTDSYVKDSRDGGEELTDYKFFCFDGVPKAMFVATDRSSQVEETKFDFFDMDFAHLPIIQGHPNANIEIAKPYAFERMKEIAGKLSRGFPQLRVDFYCTEEHVYVGELTLFHFGGFVPFEPEEWDAKFGEWIQLPDLIM